MGWRGGPVQAIAVVKRMKKASRAERIHTTENLQISSGKENYGLENYGILKMKILQMEKPIRYKRKSAI